MDEPLWKPDDVAAFLGVARRTVLLMARRGRIPARKVGRFWRFVPDDVRQNQAGRP